MTVAVPIGSVSDEDQRDAHVVLEGVEEEDAAKEQRKYSENGAHEVVTRDCMGRM